MVHRDIKPGNLMVAAQHSPGSGATIPGSARNAHLPGWPSAPLVKILDFGVARLRSLSRDGLPVGAPSAALTQEGCVVGTPEFMSPEQACNSREADIRSDIYSLGCTLFFLLAGRPPFSADTALETMVKHLKQQPPAVDQLRPGLSSSLAEAAHKMLAKDAADRYQTPAEVAAALLPFAREFVSAGAAEAAELRRPARALSDSTPALSQMPKEDTRVLARTELVGKLPVKPAGRPLAGITTFVALVLLTLLSAMVGWFVFTRLDSSTSSGEEPEDQPHTVAAAGLTLVPLPAGRFHRAGAPPSQEVFFRRPLWVGVTEVTRKQFRAFVQETGYKTAAETAPGTRRGSLVPQPGGWKRNKDVNWDSAPDDREDLPVTCITWEDAVQFCNWLSEEDGRRKCYERQGDVWTCNFRNAGYRLPTDAEWEYAARAGESTLLPRADPRLDEYGWFRHNSGGGPQPAGRKQANPRGLYDMWGNVWEWCWDWYAPLPKDNTLSDPAGPLGGTERIVWGGGWNDDVADLLKAPPRKGLPPDHCSTDVGFRVVHGIQER
jgi:formylglycine-generating enzyme required for sulfatase activity